MTRILVRCRNIHIGDILFASSVAKKLKERQVGECIVDFDLNYLQPIELLRNNPWIDAVYYKESLFEYDVIYDLIPPEVTLDPYETKPSQFQRMCGIENVDRNYEIHTNSALDYSIQRSMEELRELEWGEDTVRVAYQCDWDQKSFLYTESEYEHAEGGKTGLGYGKKRRNIFDIINKLELSDRIMLFAIGLDDKISKEYPCLNATSKFTFTASLMKNCDYVIGAEGCLTNIAAAVGTKTIITTDYIHQMFGPKGIAWQQSGGDLKNLETRQPQLGPSCYYPADNHIELNPYLRDDQVGDEILRLVTNGN
jgi:hypothetical protein